VIVRHQQATTSLREIRAQRVISATIQRPRNGCAQATYDVVVQSGGKYTTASCHTPACDRCLRFVTRFVSQTTACAYHPLRASMNRPLPRRLGCCETRLAKIRESSPRRSIHRTLHPDVDVAFVAAL
jgi:hypothetical protein